MVQFLLELCSYRALHTFFLLQLMELQSRFGADERFQMNSRFMESEEEEVEEDEEQLKKLGGISMYDGGKICFLKWIALTRDWLNCLQRHCKIIII